MPPTPASWTTRLSTLRDFWTRYGNLILLVFVALSLVPVVPKYWHETQRILGWVDKDGGIDVSFYYRWTHQWFSGINIYIDVANPDGYPPAGMVILYPFAGWLNLQQTRWVWALTTLLCFAIVTCIAIRATTTPTGLTIRGLGPPLAIIVLLLLNSGTSVTYGNGQATLLIAASLLPALLLLHRRPANWRNDLIAAALFNIALVKPNLVAPYLWLLLFFPTSIRLRPLALVTAIYLALSLLAAQFVRTPLPLLLQQFLSNRLAYADLSLDPNVHFVLGRLGLDQLLLPASAILWLGLGAWLYLNRRKDIWLLLGVTTLVMRFWGFHWIYDNVFLIVPEIVLIQTIRRGNTPRQMAVAALLLACNVVVILPPGNFGGQSQTVQYILIFTQAAVWLATLAYFVWLAAQVKIPAPTTQMAIETNSSLL